MLSIHLCNYSCSPITLQNITKHHCKVRMKTTQSEAESTIKSSSQKDAGNVSVMSNVSIAEKISMFLVKMLYLAPQNLSYLVVHVH